MVYESVTVTRAWPSGYVTRWPSGPTQRGPVTSLPWVRNGTLAFGPVMIPPGQLAKCRLRISVLHVLLYRD